MAQVKLKEAVGRKTRTIELSNAAGTKCVVDAGGHTVITDEPPERGGNDEAPPPLYYLTAAFAACQTVQIRKTADAMRFNLGEIKISCSSTTDRVPGIDGNDPVMRFTEAEMIIDLETDEPPARVERLKNLSEDMCPVGKLFEDAGCKTVLVWNTVPMKA
jgi:putative redox protein